MKTKKNCPFTVLSFSLVFFGFSTLARAAVSVDTGVYLLPLNCAELLPDPSPFSNFFEAIARGSVSSDPKLSRRLFRIISLRDKLAETSRGTRDQNPIDVLIRRTLCFYREQREPLKAITIDDPPFLFYLKSSLSDLEKKVDETVFQAELERQQRAEYERRLRDNQSIIERVQKQADTEAEKDFKRLSERARKKAKQ
jgi:hypothetical protein